MSRIDWKDYIDIDDDLHHGEPCIRGTRIPVTTIVGSFADGMKSEEIIAAFPQLTEEAIQAALAYAANVVRQELIVPFS